jgi:hypothetical protein
MTRTRSVFGMSELLVVMALVAILLGQLVPAVLKFRESLAAS